MSAQASLLNDKQSGRALAAKEKFSLAFEVAGLRVEMISAPGGPALAVPPSHDAFLVDCGAAGPGITLEIQWADKTAAATAFSSLAVPSTQAFDSGGVWMLYRRGAAHEFVFRSPATGSAPYKTAFLEGDMRRGRVHVSREVFGDLPAVYPLEYPLDELLMIHRLAGGEGVEVHACGVLDEDGRGFLFVGYSGAGKSTTARLWQAERGARILSDDRIILRRDIAGRIRMHGTPWHGEARLALPLSAPLCGVFFLEHGTRNELETLEPARAAAELLARSFLPFHDATGLEFSLDFSAGLVEEVPCSLFRFVPDSTAVRVFRNDARAL